jgi:hypothetical protein
MFTAATRVLRLRFVPKTSTAPVLDDLVIEFVAYGHECQLTGLLRLDADRLTDLLNGSDELDLVDVLALGLDGGSAEADRVIVPRSELLAVKAGNPRGRPSRRLPTRQVAVTATAGPYAIHGYMHGRPGADPMIHVGRRPPMIPLTDATIAYETASGWRRENASTLIINRDAAESIRPAREDELARLSRQYALTP